MKSRTSYLLECKLWRPLLVDVCLYCWQIWLCKVKWYCYQYYCWCMVQQYCYYQYYCWCKVLYYWCYQQYRVWQSWYYSCWCRVQQYCYYQYYCWCIRLLYQCCYCCWYCCQCCCLCSQQSLTVCRFCNSVINYILALEISKVTHVCIWLVSRLVMFSVSRFIYLKFIYLHWCFCCPPFKLSSE